MPMASSSALPESGALLPKTSGAEGRAAQDLVEQAQPDLAEPHARRARAAGGRPTGPGAFTSSWSGRDGPGQVGVVEVEGLEGEDLLVDEGPGPGQLGLVLRLGLEVPRPSSLASFGAGTARYRVPVPGDATADPHA